MDCVEGSFDSVASAAHAEDPLHVGSAAFPPILETDPVGGPEYSEVACVLVVGCDDIPSLSWWWYLSLITVCPGVVDLFS